MLGRLYYCADQSDSNTGNGTEMLVVAATGTILFCERAAISQSTKDTSEQMEASLRSFATASSGGDPVTEVPADANDVAASFTATVEGAMAITEGSGTETVFYRQGFNILSGFLWTPANDDEVILINTSTIGGVDTLDLVLPTTADTAVVWSCHLSIRELGS